MYKYIMTILAIIGLLPTSYCKIITLQRGNNISCLISNISLPIYISPPLQQPENLKNIISNAVWDEDWTLHNAMISSPGPVVDKRWEDFATVFAKLQTIKILKSVNTSISFSVHNPEKLEFQMVGTSGFIGHEQVTSKNKGEWTHYTILMENRNLSIFENDHLIVTDKVDNKIGEQIIRQIVVISNKDVYWKMHNYSFWISNSTSTQNATSVTIPPTGKSCLFFYTAMCENCFLEILSHGRNQTNIMINSTKNMVPMLNSWQQFRIDLDPNSETKLTYNRGKHDQNREPGFWGVDLRLCPKIEQDMGIYSKSIPELNTTEHQCRDMAADNTSENQTFCSEPGKLGRNCEITCEKIVGPNFKYCEQHRICMDSVCVCSWGYNGTFCEKSCQNGTWGLSCQNICAPECPTCDRRTGECMKPNETGFAPVRQIVAVLILTIVPIAAIAALYLFLHLRRNKRPKPISEGGVKEMMETQEPFVKEKF